MGYRLENETKIIKPFNYKASVSLLDSGVIVFRIPENSPENIDIVDSLVIAYKRQLDEAKILLIDIRNNPGGTIRTYSKLLPYIYTKEIVRPDGYTYVSKDLFEYEMRNLESIDSSQNKDEYNKQLRYVDSLKSVLGQLVFYKGKNKNFDTVYRKPEKVGLLVNYACMSASEAMILDMRQSAKVVVFGENTAGAIDNTNTFAMRTPSGKYSIWMPTFRGISTPLHERYAGKGISPDVRITNGEQDWLKIAIKYLESH
jgi:C-terminal processing protease CtpA/Prc